MDRSRTPVVVLLVALSWTVDAGARGVLTCRDGSLACDVDRTRNGECVLDVCESGRCGCAPVGCCIPEFCPGRAEPDVQIILHIPRGKRLIQQTVVHGIGRWTVRCRRSRR